MKKIFNIRENIENYINSLKGHKLILLYFIIDILKVIGLVLICLYAYLVIDSALRV